ncbi:GPP34 family phosphoprotein [Parafrankia discariae]|uniref:GPP34 family phosphoprotein n=1 Tax=Parafrankia discariae TaxID=365528 RepID=UPI00037AFAA2|nr:GPP34 family phosphoprotein [Parafrankia discariae]
MEPDLPTSLPAQLYLLAYNLEKDRMYPNRRLGRALRAAALTELWAGGWLADDHGLVRLAAGPTPAAGPGGSGPGGGSGRVAPTPRGGVGRADPVVAAVYRQITAADAPHTWAAWIDLDHRAAVVETRDDLEAARWVRVARGQVLVVIPTTAVALLERPRVRELNRAAGRVLRGEVEPGDAAPDLVALVALAAAGQVITLVSAGERRAFPDRLADLVTRTGPAATALAGRRESPKV